MLAANVAFLVAAIVLGQCVDSDEPRDGHVPATKRIVTPLSAVALGVLLWFVVYALARREVAKVRVEGADPRPSPKPIVIYAIASGLALFRLDRTDDVQLSINSTGGGSAHSSVLKRGVSVGVFT